MKDLSFFLLKNYIAAKMRKGIRNFCSNDDSTSTLNQHKAASIAAAASRYGQQDQPCFVSIPSLVPTNSDDINIAAAAKSSPTLEEMILQLEIDEEMARRASNNDYVNIGMRPGRLSCVNNSDILRSARNALNQYPRFSLDGKDAMYRSSFRNLDFVTACRRKSVSCSHRGFREERTISGNDFAGDLYLPQNVAGESVVWCKPGVIAKLMGLEVMPVPVGSRRSGSKETLRLLKRQNLRRRAERREMERRFDHMNTGNCHCDGLIKRDRSRSGTAEHTCVMKPVSVKASNDEGGWPTRRFGLVS